MTSQDFQRTLIKNNATLVASDIIEESKNKILNGKEGLFQIPSFMRIYLALRKGVANLGIEKMINPNSTYYDS